MEGFLFYICQLERVGEGEGWVKLGDAQEFVIFRDAVGAAERAGFDLPCASTNG